ncbi:MAG TPA: exodeoxyribonuclease VII large subunit [Casimicrobiaceae bacterium]|nr:exodeoxyribonuclease VII large subunit [Casimicrobiaceae bacterium]
MPKRDPTGDGVAGGAPVIPVSLLVSSARLLLERHLGLAWIAGEVSGYTRAASGHLYFTLKDDRAQVRCVFFKFKAQGLAFTLRDGLAVEVRATPTIYEPRGDFQLGVETIRLAGLGVLYERFLRLKAKLEAAGWFDPARKRAPPQFPRRVGVVTSLKAAALRDVLTTLRRRMPVVPVIVYPAPVQGTGAAGELARAIGEASVRGEVDVLIVCRGGGSLEDLWAFNEEELARAVFESRLPVISGVGHETDFTICDFVADARAPTPTGAAALAVPDRVALAAALAQRAQRLARGWTHAAGTCAQRLDLAARRLVHPAARLAQQDERLQALGGRLVRAAAARLGLATSALARHADALSHLNPLAVLERGYALAERSDGSVVTDAARLALGERLRLSFARGRAEADVAATEITGGVLQSPRH